jgi:hypothetical protein
MAYRKRFKKRGRRKSLRYRANRYKITRGGIRL